MIYARSADSWTRTARRRRLIQEKLKNSTYTLIACRGNYAKLLPLSRYFSVFDDMIYYIHNYKFIQNLMVDENLIKLEVKKLRETLFGHADEVLTLEQRQLQLQTVSCKHQKVQRKIFNLF